MTFTDAISDAFSKYAKFTGRSSRSAYWWFYLFALIVIFAAAFVDAAAGTGGIISVLVVLALFLPQLAVSVRRLHDAGHSGWWLLISLVPLIGAIVLLVFSLQESRGPNEWGDGPDGYVAERPSTA